MKKTLGGERLGVGNKMKVDLHGYERSTFNLSYVWRSTMSAGTLVPFCVKVAQMGDTWDINLNAFCNTHPTIGPLFGSFKVQCDMFVAPLRLYQGKLHNNKLNVGRNMASVKLPIFNLSTTRIRDARDKDNSQVNPSCILSYLGIRGVGTNPGDAEAYREFNAVPLLVYWEIYKQYYANKMEEKGAVIHRPKTVAEQHIESVTLWWGDTDTIGPVVPKYPNNNPVTWILPQWQDYLVVSLLYPYVTYDWNNLFITITRENPVNVNTPETIDVRAEDLFTIKTGIVDGGGNTSKWKLQGWNTAITGQQFAIKGWRYALDHEVRQIEPPKIATFDLTQIDDMRESIMAWTQNNTPFNVAGANKYPYNWLLQEEEYGYKPRLANQEGLGLKTYLSDLHNNWLNTEWIDGVGGINEITAVDVSDGKLQIDALILARKVYDLLNRVAVSGGSYDDWLEVVYDTQPLRKASNPMYVGGMSADIQFQEVISNSAAPADGETQPLGTLAGKGSLQHHKGGSITVKVEEPSYIMGLVSITPRIDYSQGNNWDVNIKSMDDFYKPAMAQIGFQELITDQLAWWDTQVDADGTVTFRSAGKQPAWINYMTSVNEIRGNFAIAEGTEGGGEMFMVLNRRYERDNTTGRIKDLTTYIDPTKYNHIFAQTSLDAQNFWMQIGIDATVRRKMSAKLMPNL